MCDRPQHKLFGSECLSVVTENLSVRPEYKLFRPECLSVVTENLFVRPEHKLFRPECLCFCDKTYVFVHNA
ncbi:hypothetical protein [Nostoc sp. FACHB-888]|uniref:hypothetical protein n=1 Tax=Nostoc sp. FACHB-888 TaxID=2692842 RepID=UPI0016836E0A|nr:hypothetical protein [Nostoc sp. FACHB-888]MBD2244589.1 hypothetical protein [Nostoc sp. FACHB-888]